MRPNGDHVKGMLDESSVEESLAPYLSVVPERRGNPIEWLTVNVTAPIAVA